MAAYTAVEAACLSILSMVAVDRIRIFGSIDGWQNDLKQTLLSPSSFKDHHNG